MPNSSWTGSGSTVNLAPSTTTTVTNTGDLQASPNYLTNADKIALMNQYKAELATKTSLDTTAASYSVSTSAYDAAVAAISTTLISAGAPSNWATTWPDGTTSGPWTNIKTSLNTAWATVASTRADLQAAISGAQAVAAKSQAITTAASDATTKANNALAAANQTAAGMAASDSIIPNGGFATGDGTGWTNGDGGGWAFGTLPDGSKGVTVTSGGGNSCVNTASFQVTPGRKYKLIFYVYAGSSSNTAILRLQYKADVSSFRDGYVNLLYSSVATSATYYTYDWTPSANQNFATLAVYAMAGSSPVYVKACYCVPYVQAAYIDAGAVTSQAIAASAVTAGSIASGAVVTSALTVANFDNLWPNGNSESSPPSGITPPNDGTNAEFDWRYNAGGSAYAGNWVRQITAAGSEVDLYLKIPCNSGDVFMAQCQARRISGPNSVGIFGYFLNAGGGIVWPTFIGLPGAGSNTTSSTWTFIGWKVTAPASAVTFVPYLFAGAGSVGQYDQIYVRRCSDASVIVDGSITTRQLTTGSLEVGGLSEMPTVLRARDNSNNIVGEMGTLGSAGPWGTSYGGWFKNLGVGGSSANPNLYIDNTGNWRGQNGASVDGNGNLILKNVAIIPGTTPNTTVATSYADLADLGSSNSNMTMSLNGNPTLVGMSTRFSCVSTGGYVSAIYTTWGAHYANATLGSVSFAVSGDGSGATINWGWIDNGDGTSAVSVSLVSGGSGYTYANVVQTAGTAPLTGAPTFSVNVAAITPQVGQKIYVQLVAIQNSVVTNLGRPNMTNGSYLRGQVSFTVGTPVVLHGPVVLTTDATGAAQYNCLQLYSIPAGNYTFKVQAQSTGTYAPTVQGRNFQLVELG